jgi:hypothetical protein
MSVILLSASSPCSSGRLGLGMLLDSQSWFMLEVLPLHPCAACVIIAGQP